MDPLAKGDPAVSRFFADSPNLDDVCETDSKVIARARSESLKDRSCEESPFLSSMELNLSTFLKNSFPTSEKGETSSAVSEPIPKPGLDAVKKNRSDHGRVYEECPFGVSPKACVSTSSKSTLLGKVSRITFPLSEKCEGSPSTSSQISAVSMELDIEIPISKIVEYLRSGAFEAASSEILSARENAEARQLEPFFERRLGGVIGAYGNLKLLEEYFASSFSKDFAEGFLEAEVRQNTAYGVVVEFIEMGVVCAQDENYFRHETLYNAVCCVYFSMRLDSSIRKLREKILCLRERIDRKSSKEEVFSPTFCDFCRMSLEYIYDHLILDQDLSFLLQRKYQLLKVKFPESALQIAGDLVFCEFLIQLLA